MERRRLFAALNDAGVRYVIVGGLAVIGHGHARLTVDTDLVIDLADGPARRTMELLAELGLEPRLPVDLRDFADTTTREAWITDRGMLAFTVLDPHDSLFELDLFVRSPLDFDELYDAAKQVTIGGVPVRIASIDHLIEMKRRAGRPKDLEDIAELEALRDE